jgi:hypothetical protein
MEAMVREHQMSLLDATHQKHLQERLFLIEESDSGCITPEQKIVIRKRIDYLNEENQVLDWILGLLHEESGTY